MAPENRTSDEEPFRELDEQLAALRAAAKSLREERPSPADNLFHPGRRARQEADFGASVVAALKEISASVRGALAAQQAKFGELEQQLSKFEPRFAELDRRLSERSSQEIAGLREELRQLRERQERMAGEQADATTKASEQAAEALANAAKQTAKQAAELREEIERVGRDATAKIEALATGQKELTEEFRERLQHLLDEQRVAIRQLALKASEDAVLSDRARRATELKLEELAKRLPPAPPA